MDQIAIALQALHDKIDNLTGMYGARSANWEENQTHIDQIRNTPPRPMVQRESQDFNGDPNRVN